MQIEEEPLGIPEEAMLTPEEQFYVEPYYLSPSALNKYLWRPRAWFEWYVLKQQEDRKETKALREGSLIHLLILEPNEFEQRFVISLDELVKDKQKIILDSAFTFARRGFYSWSEMEGHGRLVDAPFVEVENIRSYLILILDMMRANDYYQALKDDKERTGDEKRLEKILTPQAEEYWEFLKKKEGRILITQESYEFCHKAASLISGNPEYREVMGLDPQEGVEVYNEWELKFDTPSKGFGIKGILDNVVVNHKEKLIILNDIKTTSKSLNEFAKESIQHFGYDIQLAIYVSLIALKFTGLMNQGYNVQVGIITVSSYGESYRFCVSEETLGEWFEKMGRAMNDFEWSYRRRDFSNHRIFIEDGYIL